MQGEDDAQSHNLLSRKAKLGRSRLGNQEVDDLASYSESNNESLRPDHSHNNCNLYGLERNMSIGNQTKAPINNNHNNNKASKRKAEESRNLLVVQSERNPAQDPRIVRANRASGGKDRHSKVRTSKGLRDRRVRLSVSTAIQFYDLQDRLGFEQPSKAVDWLINKAKGAIDELPVLETDTAGAVCNLAAAESALLSQKAEEAANAAQILNQGRLSSSSTSDGSIQGGETSQSSLSKTRRKEARERAKKKSASARDTGPHPHQLNEMRSSFAELLNNVVSYTPIQEKPQCSPGDHHNHSSYGLPNQVSSSSSNIQQLWDSVSSYTDILCQDAADERHRQQLHLMASLCSSSHATMDHSSPPPGSVAAAAVGSTYLRRYNEMGNSGIQLFNAPNLKLGQAINLYSEPMRSFGKNDMVESQELQKQFASTFNVSPFSNDVNFSTSCLSSRGALQSNSSSAHPNTPSLHASTKNAYGDASAQLHFDVPPGETHHFQGLDAQFPERFQQGFTFEGECARHEHAYISVPRRR